MIKTALYMSTFFSSFPLSQELFKLKDSYIVQYKHNTLLSK